MQQDESTVPSVFTTTQARDIGEKLVSTGAASTWSSSVWV